MYLTEKKFNKEMGLVNDRFNILEGKLDGLMIAMNDGFRSLNGRISRLEIEVTGIYPLIREVGEHFHLKLGTKADRIMKEQP